MQSKVTRYVNYEKITKKIFFGTNKNVKPKGNRKPKRDRKSRNSNRKI